MQNTAVNPVDLKTEQASRVALNAFFTITHAWGADSQQQQILLGQPARSTFYAWRKQSGPKASRDTLERVSYILGIYKALKILFPTDQQANEWPSKANEYFSGQSALDVMLSGSVLSLADVRRYLDAIRG